jgi:hypothetical protein
MLAGGAAPTLIAPKIHPLYLLAPMTVSLDATEVRPKAYFSRQAWTRDRLVTPSVCLGPAFRSHAPPSLG